MHNIWTYLLLFFKYAAQKLCAKLKTAKNIRSKLAKKNRKLAYFIALAD